MIYSCHSSSVDRVVHTDFDSFDMVFSFSNKTVEVQTRQSNLGDTTDDGTALVDFRTFPYRPLDDLITEAE